MAKHNYGRSKVSDNALVGAICFFAVLSFFLSKAVIEGEPQQRKAA